MSRRLKVWTCETCGLTSDTTRRSQWVSTGMSERNPNTAAHFCPTCFDGWWEQRGRVYDWWARRYARRVVSVVERLV